MGAGGAATRAGACSSSSSSVGTGGFNPGLEAHQLAAGQQPGPAVRRARALTLCARAWAGRAVRST